jgi:hypothetical protein
VVVAKAAAIAGDWQLEAVIPELRAAFQRLMEKPAQSDPQCWGKTAVAKALKDLGLREADTFLQGARHVQMEATWGGQIDTASALRGTCTLALPQCNDISRDEILRELLDALTEPEARVRADAALALEQIGGPDVILLLRLKARAGDKELAVTGRVLESLLQLEGPRAVPFVTEFLAGKDEDLAGEAALALGASRLPDAVQVLQDFWSKPLGRRGRDLGPAVLRGISASRLDAAFEFLLQLIQNGRPVDARDALEALDLHRDSEEIVVRIREAVAARADAELQAAFAARFK